MPSRFWRACTATSLWAFPSSNADGGVRDERSVTDLDTVKDLFCSRQCSLRTESPRNHSPFLYF